MHKAQINSSEVEGLENTSLSFEDHFALKKTGIPLLRMSLFLLLATANPFNAPSPVYKSPRPLISWVAFHTSVIFLFYTSITLLYVCIQAVVERHIAFLRVCAYLASSLSQSVSTASQSAGTGSQWHYVDVMGDWAGRADAGFGYNRKMKGEKKEF